MTTTTSVGRQLNVFLEVLYEPRWAFQKIQRSPAWWFPCIVNALLTMVLVTVQEPFAERLALLSLPPGMPPDALAGLTTLRLVGAIVPILALPLRWLFTSAVLFAMIIAMDWDWPEFKGVFCIVSFSQVILTLGETVHTISLVWRGVDSIRSVADMATIPTVARLLGTLVGRPALVSALDTLGPFTVWHILVLGVGVSVLTKQSLTQTIWAPILVCLMAILLKASVVVLL